MCFLRLKRDVAPAPSLSTQRVPPGTSRPRMDAGPSSDRMRARMNDTRPRMGTSNPSARDSNVNNSGRNFQRQPPRVGGNSRPFVDRNSSSSGNNDIRRRGSLQSGKVGSLGEVDGESDFDDDSEEGEERRVDRESKDTFLDEDETVEDLDDEDRDSIFDGKGWSDAVRDGYTIETGHMDLLDRFMAHAFTESFKTKDDTFTVIEEPERMPSVPVPQPRSMNQLLYAMEPNVRSSELGSAGHLLGETAWSVSNLWTVDFLS